MLQNALHAGELVAAQPDITLLDPRVSIVWGALVLGERLRSGIFILLGVISGAAIAASAVRLSESLRVEERDLG